MGHKVQINFGFCIFLALMILLLPIPWWTGAIIAALIHEGFHIMAVLICGGKIYDLSVTGMGAKIEAMSMTNAKQVFCALAGPLGSFSCLAASEYFPELAICGLIQGAYNLLPIFPLDGGRIIKYICAEGLCRGIEVFTLVMLTGIGLWLGTQSREVVLFFLISAWYPMIQRKISCKERNLAVQ